MSLTRLLSTVQKGSKYIITKLTRPILFCIFFVKYRIKNSHNFTVPIYTGGGIGLFDINSVTIGKYTYGDIEVHMWGEKGECLQIGNYCSISHDVTFILGGNHAFKTLLTYPVGIINNLPGAHEKEYYTNGKIIVGDDVWIGTGAKILSGVTLGQGSIVAAYAVVTKSVPPYAIVGGVPAKIIKYRFPEEDIAKLINLDFNTISPEMLISIYDEISVEGFDVDKVCDFLIVNRSK